MRKFTLTEKLTLVLASMHEQGSREIHESDLTVAAWNMFPDTFGLGGYENDHPNHKSVCNAYMTSKDSTTCVIGKGYMIRTRPKYYGITTACVDRANELNNRSTPSVDDTLTIHQEEIDKLRRAYLSTGMKHYSSNNEISPDWNTCVAFLEIHTPSFKGKGPKEVNAIKKQNLGNVSAWGGELQNYIDSGNERFKISGQGGSGGKDTIYRGQILLIGDLFNALLEKWESHLSRFGVSGIDIIQLPEASE